MQRKVIALCAFLFTGITLTGLKGQENINTSGGIASGAGCSASYSIGQLRYHIYEGAGGSVSEGIQQPYEISITTSIDMVGAVNLKISLYPNPAHDFLLLEVKDAEHSHADFWDISYRLYDLQGKLLRNEKVTSNFSRIDINHLAPATYLLEVILDNRKVKIFQVIKW
jgi:hypothetical protein